MKTPLPPRFAIVSCRLVLSALILVASGSLVVLPVDSLARHRQEVNANAGHAASVAQHLAATEAAQVRALGERSIRAYERIFIRVERDFQHFFKLLPGSPKAEFQIAPDPGSLSGRESALLPSATPFRHAHLLSYP
jgi:hypothetical protein